MSWWILITLNCSSIWCSCWTFSKPCIRISYIHIRSIYLIYILSFKWNHCLPWVYMIYNYMRGYRKSFIKKSILKYFCHILLIFDNSRKFIIMKLYLISLNKVIIEMNREYLRVLYWFFRFIWQILMINIFLSLISIICWSCSSMSRTTSMSRTSSMAWFVLLRAWRLLLSVCFRSLF